MPDDIKDLIVKQGEAFSEFKDAQTKRLDTLEKKLGDAAEATEKATKALEAYDQFKDRLDEIATNQQKAQALAVLGNGMTAADHKIEQAFAKFARTGKASDYQEIAAQNSMQVKNDPDGGFTVPESTAKRIITASMGSNPMRKLARQETITLGDNYTYIVDADDLSTEEHGEGFAAADTDTPKILLGKIELHKMDAEPKVSITLLEDSGWDIAAYLENKAVRRFTKQENSWFTSGNGSKQARGLCTYGVIDNDAFEANVCGKWGSFGGVVSGNAGLIPNADCLLTLIDALQADYLPNAAFQTSRKAFTAIRLLKATKSLAGDQLYQLWQPSLQPGQPDQLFGYPVYKNDAFDSVAAGKIPVAFGDFAETYTIVDKLGMTALRNPYKSNAFIYFYFRRRTGGDVVNFESCKFLKIAANF